MHGADKVIDFSTVDDSNFDMLGQKVVENETPQQEEGAEPEDESKLRVQNLPQSQRAYAEKLVPFIGGERIPCLMFQSRWNLREKGV